MPLRLRARRTRKRFARSTGALSHNGRRARLTLVAFQQAAIGDVFRPPHFNFRLFMIRHPGVFFRHENQRLRALAQMERAGELHTIPPEILNRNIVGRVKTPRRRSLARQHRRYSE
jgi:hypothetical protein